MVGYVQRIAPDLARSEVNAHLDTAGLPALGKTLLVGPHVSRCAHELSRPFAHSPFRLLHLWRLPG